ncbi:MAG: 2,3-bisphosphoglycerate-independent phosphoglycerate mutase [Parcubacteria group bacterium GW2011_GWC2_39_14]|nr:MAG: 2,3-bisphosphoglycerate-independent phosphoglycerate mutase [Parcubacteria group bacterium GW2011_GWC2_39_14]KKR54424.1 MAG: 2,3-bisphosphoglycerate-independent phosphoglycerate mutase [Parcubacteria group bacterium GW2011_GWA2_40_23]
MVPVVLLILDGWGIAKKNKGNAIELAHKPYFDRLWHEYPHAQLKAHGKYVGLPDDQVGNSEAGHLNIGAGRIIKQDSVLIFEAIAEGRFPKNLALNSTLQNVITNKSELHLMGLVSEEESPHSSLDHLYALVDLAYVRGVKNIHLHLFTDGRDSRQFATINIIDKIIARIDGQARLSTLIGRYYAMDRGKNWDRTEKAFRCLVQGQGLVFRSSHEALLHAYNQKKTDEYIEPSIIATDKKTVKDSRIKDNDAVIFFNLRSDRARQLTKSFVQDKFNKLNPNAFVRGPMLKNLTFCTLTDFGPDLDDIKTVFPSADIKNTLPMILKNHKQVYLAETEKYAHMTYFINGGYSEKVDSEGRLQIVSDNIMSYADRPVMKVNELTSAVKDFLKQKYAFIAVNFANPDMVGHTGNLQSTIKAIEDVDKCLGRIADAVLKKKGVLIVTADHGNAEKMIDLETNEVWAGHTTNPVPFIIVSNKKIKKLRPDGVLGDIAPTIYDLLEIKSLPTELNNSLIKK